MGRLWITPENDLEAVEIVKMLKEKGEEYNLHPTSRTSKKRVQNLLRFYAAR